MANYVFNSVVNTNIPPKLDFRIRNWNRPPLSKNSPIGESFYEVKLAIGDHLYNTEDQPKSSSSPSFTAISVAWVNRYRRKKNKKILDAAEILGRKSTLYDQNFKRIFAKKSQLHCTEVLCYFFLFSLFRSLKSSLGWIILQPFALKRLKLNLESQVQSNLHVLRGTVLSGHPVSNGRFSKSRNLLPFTTVISQLY